MNHRTRRQFLRELAYIGAFVSLPATASNRTASGGSVDALAVRLHEVLKHSASAKVLGQRYLELTPREADINVLTALIGRTPENTAQLLQAGRHQLRTLLAAQQRMDFGSRRTVSIDGWILSETEARLCALAALSEASGVRASFRHG